MLETGTWSSHLKQIWFKFCLKLGHDHHIYSKYDSNFVWNLEIIEMIKIWGDDSVNEIKTKILVPMFQTWTGKSCNQSMFRNVFNKSKEMAICRTKIARISGESMNSPEVIQRFWISQLLIIQVFYNVFWQNIASARCICSITSSFLQLLDFSNAKIADLFFY